MPGVDAGGALVTGSRDTAQGGWPASPGWGGVGENGGRRRVARQLRRQGSTNGTVTG